MKVLVIGKGGREHALVWKLAASSRVSAVYCAPGNAGTAAEAVNVDISPTDFPRLLKFAKGEQIDLTVVGPEEPLVLGIVDVFSAEGLRIFGPTKAAAELEGSKIFSKELMRSAGVPTADFHVFRDVESAKRFVTEREDSPVVVKADGLAAGKGVIVCASRDQAVQAVDRMMLAEEFGQAGKRIVIEERLDGDEVSILALTDGQTILPLEPCQDHKPAFDGDLGPNTGGMGAYCPTPLVTPDHMEEIDSRILVPAIHALKRSRRRFRGLLYAGLMITNQGPRVLEFNVRFGDPEAQPLLMRLKTDLVDLMEACLESRLAEIGPLEWDPRPALCVVMASDGYPGKYERGATIRGLEAAGAIPNVKVFHAGTAAHDGNVLTDGGRVLGVTAIGKSISDAKRLAYSAVKEIRWPGAWCRHDISDKARKHPAGDAG
jgi:phosphoribosylamine--glycine ligase